MNSLRNDIVKRAWSHHVYVPLERKREGGKERERERKGNGTVNARKYRSGVQT